MSESLDPQGHRRVHGSAAIDRHVKAYALKDRDHRAEAASSIASGNRHLDGAPHAGSREAARRLRQLERKGKRS